MGRQRTTRLPAVKRCISEPGRWQYRRRHCLLSNPELRSPLAQRFERPLPTPPVLTPVRTDATTDYYEITQRECKMRIRS
jgi:hypothetical protein